MTKTMQEIQANAILAHLSGALVQTIDSRIESNQPERVDFVNGSTPTWYEYSICPDGEERDAYFALLHERLKVMEFVMDDPEFAETCQAAIETFVDDVVQLQHPYLMTPDDERCEDILDPSDYLAIELKELADILAFNANA